MLQERELLPPARYPKLQVEVVEDLLTDLDDRLVGSQLGTSGSGLSLTIIIIIAGGAALCIACFVGSFLVAMCCTKRHPKPEPAIMMRSHSVGEMPTLSTVHVADEDDAHYRNYE